MKKSRVCSVFVVVLATLFLLSGCAKSSHISIGELFSTDEYEGVVFYSPHQDDETLNYSQLITHAVDTFGAEHVYVVLISDGAASYVINVDPVAGPIGEILDGVGKEIGQDINTEENRKLIFSIARDNEFVAAVHTLGIENIAINTLPDGDVLNHLDEVKEIIKNSNTDYEDGKLYNISFSPVFENHRDHRAIGQALLELYESDRETYSGALFVRKADLPILDKKLYYKSLFHKGYKSYYIDDQTGSDIWSAATSEYTVYETEMIPDIIDDIARLVKDGVSVEEAIKGSEQLRTLRLSVGTQSVDNCFSYVNKHIEEKKTTTTIHVKE